MVGANANKVAGVGIFSRARGFFVEPTDYALALNAFFPICIGLSILSNRKKVRLLIGAYVICLFLSRSAAGFAGLFIGLVIAFILHPRKKEFFISVLSFRVMGFVALIVVTIGDYIWEVLQVVILKASFAEALRSSSGRGEVYMQYLFFHKDFGWNFLFGFGTGFVSGSPLQSTLSWPLSVYVEKGLAGLIVLLSLILLSVFNVYAVRSLTLRTGLMVASIAVSLHLFTQSGYYMPLFWLVLFLSVIRWDDLIARNLVPSEKT